MKLKNCPFCGGKASFHKKEWGINRHWTRNTVGCDTCGIYGTGLDAWKIWNKRVNNEQKAKL